jgi:aspartyl-tRNA synthetase
MKSPKATSDPMADNGRPARRDQVVQSTGRNSNRKQIRDAELPENGDVELVRQTEKSLQKGTASPLSFQGSAAARIGHQCQARYLDLCCASSSLLRTLLKDATSLL